MKVITVAPNYNNKNSSTSFTSRASRLEAAMKYAATQLEDKDLIRGKLVYDGANFLEALVATFNRRVRGKFVDKTPMDIGGLSAYACEPEGIIGYFRNKLAVRRINAAVKRGEVSTRKVSEQGLIPTLNYNTEGDFLGHGSVTGTVTRTMFEYKPKVGQPIKFDVED